MLLTALGTVLLCSVLIKYACDSFETSSYHLGAHVFRMPPGVRGATLEAIGSSMPELLTTFFLLFLYQDLGGFSAGVATCAGSAVFNAVVIPALCILAVTVKSRAMPQPLPFIRLDRAVILRDGLFFLAAEVALILFLGGTVLSWWMGGLLMLIYGIYFTFLMWQMRPTGAGAVDEPEEQVSHRQVADEQINHEQDPESDQRPRAWWLKLLTQDWNGLFFRDRPYSAASAWTVLTLSVLSLSVSCYFLAEAVMRSAEALGVPGYFTAVILGAAATSVPDTFISVGNALKGDYDDAVANAVGSNIFDICVALGLPLLIYGWIYGDIHMQTVAGLSSADIQPLRIALLGITVLVMALFLWERQEENGTRVGRTQAYGLIALYLIWNITIFIQAAEPAWVTDLLGASS